MRVALVCAAALLSGCVLNHGDFTVISNKLMRLSEFELSKADRKKGVVGQDIAHIILFIPTKGQITIEEAVDDALNKGGGDVLTDAKVKSWFWYIPYIYGQAGWSVTGDVVKTRRN
ncbi:MAG: hypothetical protein KDC87_02180 [Planctomycetes bacterium]|nr:hypothetical protein [Planctomycetota bacterium]